MGGVEVVAPGGQPRPWEAHGVSSGNCCPAYSVSMIALAFLPARPRLELEPVAGWQLEVAMA